jgi:tetratricopeptide (TPR) repeat protein
MNKRLELLEGLVGEGSADPFHRYALALEYKREKRHADALATFEALRAVQPDYLPMYMMAGLLLLELDHAEAARAWLEQGLAVARQQGDAKTAGELEEAIEKTSGT